MKEIIQMIWRSRVRKGLWWLVILILAPFALQFWLTFALTALVVIVDVLIAPILFAVGLTHSPHVFTYVTYAEGSPHRHRNRIPSQPTTINVRQPEPTSDATEEASPHSSHPEPLFVPAFCFPGVEVGQDDTLQRQH